MRTSRMTPTQKAEWQRLLSGYLQRTRLGLPYNYADALVAGWHEQYCMLMDMKLKIIEAVRKEEEREIEEM